jgi:predicted transcriptional regulator
MVKMEAKNIKIKETFDYLYLYEKNMTMAQKDFIASLKKYYQKNKKLSEKQTATLFEIKKYLNISGQPVRFSRVFITTH